MIKFSLVCDKEHKFESWFASGAAYDEQTGRGLIDCPVCGTSKVTKAIMAPAIAIRRGQVRQDQVHEGQMAAGKALEGQVSGNQIPEGKVLEGEVMTPSQLAKPAQISLPPALLDPQHLEIREMLGTIRAKILADTVDVGKRFPEEARKMHDGETPERPIRGEATAEEVHALIEDGINIVPVPMAPEDLN